jgi:DNA polymerase elongation subunit (family B)
MPENFNDLVDVADQFVKLNLEEGVLVPQFAELAARLGSVRSTLSMKREAIADRGLFRAKKNYVLQVWDNEGVRFTKPDMKMVGIETARTTTPKMCRDMLTETLEIIMNRDEAELAEKYHKWKDDFMSAPLHDIAFPRGVNDIGKWRGEDGIPKKGTPIQVKAAIAYNLMLDRHDMKEIERIKDGSKLKFLYLKPNNPVGLNVIGLVDELPSEFGLDDWVDKETQFEKALANPIESFTTLVGWNPTGRRMSLGDDYFSSAVEEGGSPRTSPTPKPRTSSARVKPESEETRVRGTSTPKAKAKKAPKPTLDGLFG